MGTRSLVVLIYLFVTAICVAVSTWSSFQGFRSLFGLLALPIALVIGAALFACDLVIQRNRREGLPLWGAVLMLAIAACPSAVSNYSFFYTNALRDRVGAERFQEAYAVFDRNLGAALAALRSEDGRRRYEALRADAREELAALRAEMLDPRNLGLGDKARAHLEALERLTPRALQTPAPPISHDEAELLSWVDRYESLVLDQLDRMAADDAPGAAITDIEARRADAQAHFAVLQAAPLDERRRQIAAWEIETAAVETLATQALPGATPLALKPVRAVDAELGEIVYSLRSGFLERPSLGTTAFALSAAVLIDVFPLILALLLIAPGAAMRREARADEPVSYRRVGLIN
jgi:hypothetical protein